MKRPLKTMIGLLLPIACLFLALFHEWTSLNGISFLPFHERGLDILIAVGLLGLFFTLLHVKWIHRFDLMQKLRLAGGSVLAVWILVQLIQSQSSISNAAWAEFFERHFLPVFGLMICILVFIVIALIKDLVYIQQNKHTAAQFHFLVIVMIASLVYPLLDRTLSPGSNVDFALDFEYSIGYRIFTGFTVLAGMLIGARCKWIHYLRKKQKLQVFFSGLIVFALTSSALGTMRTALHEFSPAMSHFLYSFWIVWCIYSGMSLLCLLFQLPAAGLLDRRAREMASMQAMSMVINSIFNTQDLISKSLGHARKIVDADFVWVELAGKNGLTIAGAEGIVFSDLEEIPKTAMENIREIVRTRENAALVNHVTKDKRTSEMGKWKRAIASMIIAKLQHNQKTIGYLYVASRRPFAFVDESRTLIQAFANQVAAALENARLVELSLEQERYKEELRVAHEAQMRLLPQTLPKLDNVEIDGFCMTANDIGGDFYDVIQMEPDRLDIVIGDVSGKGASAAFYMAELKGVIQTLGMHYNNPKDILLKTNTFIRKNFEPSTFVTMIYAIYTPSARKIQIARAGHTPVGYLSSGKLTWLESKGVGLGLMDSEQLKEHLDAENVPFKQSDQLFFYTDGLIEAKNRDHEEFGEERLTELLKKHQDEHVASLFDYLKKAIAQFTQGMSRFDDITVVMIKLLES